MPRIKDYKVYLRNRVRVNPKTGCWEWTRATNVTGGYGVLTYRSKQWKAHRMSYTVFVGEIPDGMYVLHSCDVRTCINPDHLRVGTAQDNVDDMFRRGRARPAKGAGHCWARHTDDEVIAAIRRWFAGDTQADIASDMGVAQTAVSAWCRGAARKPCRESALLLENP